MEEIKQGLDKIYDLLNVVCGNCIIEDDERDNLQYVICDVENLLKRYKELEEQNKTLTDEYMIQKHLINADFLKDYIPISVIQNKIDELVNKIVNLDNTVYANSYIKPQYDYKIQVLQELLEERNK